MLIAYLLGLASGIASMIVLGACLAVRSKP